MKRANKVNPHKWTRKVWGFNPATRVKQSKKIYNRHKYKKIAMHEYE